MSAPFLVVRTPFAQYKAGDAIADPATVTAILASESAPFVISVADTSDLETFLAALGLINAPPPTPSGGNALLLSLDLGSSFVAY